MPLAAERPSSAGPRRRKHGGPIPCTTKFPPRPGVTQAGTLPPQSEDGGLRVFFGRSPGLVYAPSGWRPEASGGPSVPCALKRDYVYGYNGSCLRSLHFISNTECVYPVAALVVVLDLTSNRQRYFEHSNDVTCVDWCEKRQICASGQVDRKGVDGPVVCLWDPRDPQRTIVDLDHPSHTRWITAVGFSPDGQSLVTFTGDDRNTAYIWRDFARWDGLTDMKRRAYLIDSFPRDRRKSAPLYSTSTGGYPVHSIFMSPDSSQDGRTVIFYTLGRRNFKWWSASFGEGPEGETVPSVSSKTGTYGKCSVPKSPTCVAFGATGQRLQGGGQAERGTAWMTGDNGHFFALMGSSATREKRIVPQSSSAPLGCVAELPDGRWLAGSGDGLLYFGRTDPAPRVEEQLAFHELAGEEAKLFRGSSVPRFASIAVRGRLALLGTSNHCILMLDWERKALLKVLQVSHAEEAAALDHHPTLAIMATASVARDIRFWNTAERRPAVGKVFRAQHAVRSLAFSPRDGSLLAVGCDKGLLEVYAFPSMQSVFRGSISRVGERIGDVRFSDDGAFLGAACWDQAVYLLRVAGGRDGAPDLRMHRVLLGNSSSPTHVMFSANGEYIMSNSRDGQILFWRTKDGSAAQSISAMRDTQWQAPWTCVLGWPVAGIWSSLGYDLTDVKSACQAHAPDDGVFAIGDDNGRVKLFRFPCPYVDPPCESYGGHASFVTRVRFSKGNVLASLGGDDHSICQWSLDYSSREPSGPRGPPRPSPPPYHTSDPPAERISSLGREGRLGRPRGPPADDHGRRPVDPMAVTQPNMGGPPPGGAGLPRPQSAADVLGGIPSAASVGDLRSSQDAPAQDPALAGSAAAAAWANRRALSASARNPPPFAVEAEAGQQSVDAAPPSRAPRPASAAGHRRPPSPAPQQQRRPPSPGPGQQPRRPPSPAAGAFAQAPREPEPTFQERRWPGGQSAYYQRSQGVSQALRWD